jgi:hypothetical protein
MKYLLGFRKQAEPSFLWNIVTYNLIPRWNTWPPESSRYW